MSDLLGLLLYCMQQLGVTLGLGAQTILLVGYLLAMRDGIVDSKEAQFARAVRGVLMVGLAFVLISGSVITGIHVMSGQQDTVLSAAYLFKWALILLVLVLSILARYSMQSIMLGLAGGSWYALFVVHILAPVTSWANLLTLYGVWMVGFIICWMASVFMLSGKSGEKVSVTPTPTLASIPVKELPKKNPEPKPLVAPTMPQKVFTPAPAPAPKVAPVAPPAFVPKPVAPPLNLPVLQVATPPREIIMPTITATPKPEVQTEVKKETKIEDPDKMPGLPAIQVMPKTPGDLENQNRASVVKFD